MEAFTPRNVAKFVVKTLVAGKAAAIAEDVIVSRTSLEEDTTIVDISSSLVGWYVSDRLQPYTDKIVDKTADWIVARRKQSEKETAE